MKNIPTMLHCLDGVLGVMRGVGFAPDIAFSLMDKKLKCMSMTWNPNKNLFKLQVIMQQNRENAKGGEYFCKAQTQPIEWGLRGVYNMNFPHQVLIHSIPIGFRSRLWLGQSKTQIFFLLNHYLVDLLECFGSLPCWKTHFLLHCVFISWKSHWTHGWYDPVVAGHPSLNCWSGIVKNWPRVG
jgi:hypothetical protein